MKEKVTIQILGTGTILSDRNRSCSSTLIKHKNLNILVDAGPGTYTRLKEVNIKSNELNYIFITHFHPDHVSDLIPILFSLANLPETEGRVSLNVIGPVGLNNFIKGMELSYGNWLEIFRTKFNLIELTNEIFLYEDFTFIWKKLKHTHESIGYRFEFNDKVVAISGDSGYCSELIELSQNADIAILECAYPDSFQVEGHLSPGLVGKIAQQIKVKKIVLTHLYPETFNSNPLKIIKNYYQGCMVIGKDLDQFSL